MYTFGSADSAITLARDLVLPPLVQYTNRMPTAHVEMASSGVCPDRCYCEFLAEVGDEYKCKVCGRVAIGLVLLGCCGEYACEACVSLFREDSQPCPSLTSLGCLMSSTESLS